MCNNAIFQSWLISLSVLQYIFEELQQLGVGGWVVVGMVGGGGGDHKTCIR